MMFVKALCNFFFLIITDMDVVYKCMMTDYLFENEQAFLFVPTRTLRILWSALTKDLDGIHCR